MSHVTTITIEIRDLDAVREICKDLGLEFKENQKTYRWYGRHIGDYPLPEGISKSQLGRCDHALAVKGAGRETYEVGLVKQGDKWVPLWDFWQGGYGLEACVGKGGKKLIAAYSRAVGIKNARAFAKAKGFSCTEKVDSETNETVIYLRRYS